MGAPPRNRHSSPKGKDNTNGGKKCWMRDDNYLRATPLWRNKHDKQMKSVVVCHGVSSNGREAFMCENLKSVTLPNLVESVSEGAFRVVKGGDCTFRGCEALTRIAIPWSVELKGSDRSLIVIH